MSPALDNPALTISLALICGITAQSIAHHLRIPGIVLLLGVGAALGPEWANLVRPHTLGPSLQTLVGFAVAVILFEGGLNLQVSRLRREAVTIRRLISLGAAVTALGAALAAHLLLGWTVALSLLFGTLVIVTGPTVIAPLLRRIRLRSSLATILDAEAVLIDPVGAIVAVVALELLAAQHDATTTIAIGLARLGVGLLTGLAGGLALGLLLRAEQLVPEGYENVFTLSFVLALFQGSNALIDESGIMAVTCAGLVVGNIGTRVDRELAEFKEQLTVMFIGMLFVLLAADVRLEDVRALGGPGVLTVAALMFVVRPLNIFLCTWGSGLNVREKLFLSWLAPRGIVAAAIASLFADSLGEAGGVQLRALVFLVIAMTVLIQGLSGGFVARILGVRRPTAQGYLIVGANELGLELGAALKTGPDEVVFVDSNPFACRAAEERGFRVVFGNALEERTLLRAEVDSRASCVALTPNGEVNLLFARHAQHEARGAEYIVALPRGEIGVTSEMVRESGCLVAFKEPRDLQLWTVRLRRKLARGQVYRLAGEHEDPLGGTPEALLLPLAIRRGKRVFPYSSGVQVKSRDEAIVLVFEEREEEARAWLTERGWERMAEEA